MGSGGGRGEPRFSATAKGAPQLKWMGGGGGGLAARRGGLIYKHLEARSGEAEEKRGGRERGEFWRRK